jgi:glycosyltransferase involved in cell wall biosynthesis
VIAHRSGREVNVIHNGFDPSLFERTATRPSPVFRLVYAGKLVWPQQDPRPLLQALQQCLQTNQILASDLELAFYGSDLKPFRRAWPGALDGLPVREYGRIPHLEIIEVLQASPVLVVFAHARERGVLTGKLFDYLGAGQAILAVPDDAGDIASVLRRTGAGLSLSSADDIAAQLALWYKAWKRGLPLISKRNETEIAQYSRREQTRALAGLLNAIAKA